MATKKNKKFVRNLHNNSSRFITFLSKPNRIEPNLFKENNKKTNPVKTGIWNLKASVYDTIEDKVRALFRRTTKKEKSLDTKVKVDVVDVKRKSDGTRLATKKISMRYKPIITDYTARSDLISLKRRSALNKLYGSSVDYLKDSYKIVNTTKRIKEGPVKITAGKLNIGAYHFAVLNPQWNMPTLSKFDYDTLSPAITNTISIGKKDIKHNPFYSMLKYRFSRKPWHQREEE